MKTNNTAQKTALEVEKISKALREGTEKTLQNLIKEAINDIVNDGKDVKEDEPIEDDSFEVQDVETEKPSDTSTDVEPGDVDNPSGEDDVPADTDKPAEDDGDVQADDDANDEWSDFEAFKVGDNDYDFTGVDGETALKIYNKLGDDDQIFVKKEDDGKYSVKDNESGAEFVIELNPEGSDDANAVDDNQHQDEPTGDDEPIEGDDDVQAGDDVPADTDKPAEDDEEFEITLDDDDEQQLDEENNFTDDYQSKDPIDGLNMTEPANKQATYSMDGGAPQGTQKPWAGKGDSKPFDKTVNEQQEGVCPKCGKKPCTCKEQELDEAGAARTSVKKSHVVKGDKEKPEGFPARGPQALQEMQDKMKRIVETAKAIQAENKQYQEVIGKIKQSLYEAYALNVNYGKITDLLVNETTTKDEKKSIVERFSNVKTIKEGNQLYDSIKRELNESNKKTTPLIDEQISANSSKTINETTLFQNDPSYNLMQRMDNLFSKRK